MKRYDYLIQKRERRHSQGKRLSKEEDEELQKLRPNVFTPIITMFELLYETVAKNQELRKIHREQRRQSGGGGGTASTDAKSKGENGNDDDDDDEDDDEEADAAADANLSGAKISAKEAKRLSQLEESLLPLLTKIILFIEENKKKNKNGEEEADEEEKYPDIGTTAKNSAILVIRRIKKWWNDLISGGASDLSSKINLKKAIPQLPDNPDDMNKLVDKATTAVQEPLKKIEKLLSNDVRDIASSSVEGIMNALSLIPGIGTTLQLWRLLQNVIVIMSKSVTTMAGAKTQGVDLKKNVMGLKGDMESLASNPQALAGSAMGALGAGGAGGAMGALGALGAGGAGGALGALGAGGAAAAGDGGAGGAAAAGAGGDGGAAAAGGDGGAAGAGGDAAGGDAAAAGGDAAAAGGDAAAAAGGGDAAAAAGGGDGGAAGGDAAAAAAGNAGPGGLGGLGGMLGAAANAGPGGLSGMLGAAAGNAGPGGLGGMLSAAANAANVAGNAGPGGLSGMLGAAANAANVAGNAGPGGLSGMLSAAANAAHAAATPGAAGQQDPIVQNLVNSLKQAAIASGVSPEVAATKIDQAVKSSLAQGSPLNEIAKTALMFAGVPPSETQKAFNMASAGLQAAGITPDKIANALKDPEKLLKGLSSAAGAASEFANMSDKIMSGKASPADLWKMGKAGLSTANAISDATGIPLTSIGKGALAAANVAGVTPGGIMGMGKRMILGGGAASSPSPSPSPSPSLRSTKKYKREYKQSLREIRKTRKRIMKYLRNII